MSDYLAERAPDPFLGNTVRMAPNNGVISNRVNLDDGFRSELVLELTDIALNHPNPDKEAGDGFKIAHVGVLADPNSIFDSELLAGYPATKTLVDFLVRSVNLGIVDEHDHWVPDDLTVNSYEPGDRIDRHYDSSYRTLVDDITRLTDMILELTGQVKYDEVEGLLAKLDQDLGLAMNHPNSVDLLYQVQGAKQLIVYPSYLPPMDQYQCLQNVRVHEMTQGTVIALRREQVAHDRFPIYHAVPPTTEPSISIVLARYSRGAKDPVHIPTEDMFKYLMLRQYLLQKT